MGMDILYHLLAIAISNMIAFLSALSFARRGPEQKPSVPNYN